MNESDFVKASNVFSQIEMMKPLIRVSDWTGLEQQCEQRCRDHAGQADTQRIAGVSMQAYEEALSRALSQAIGNCKASGAKAIYFEFDMEYDWRSWLFICPAYPTRWDRLLGTDYLEEVDGPKMAALAKIYGELQLFAPVPREASMTSYLIGRTFASFGRSSQRFANSGVAFGMAFHDEDEIIRVHEGTNAA
jgi:hypothetical protein